MIRHCVFIRFRSTVSDTEKQAIFAEITALKPRIPGFITAHVGPNVSPETGMDMGRSEGFIVDFENAKARDAYLADPEHAKTGMKIVEAALGGVDGIFVYDLEVTA